MILIFTEYFYPITNGGGPVRSVEQIIKCLEADLEFKIITSAEDHQGLISKEISLFNKFFSLSSINSEILYVTRSFKGLIKLILTIYHHRNYTFYINGIFKPHLSLLPALIGKKIIISPRGMLLKESWKSGSFLKYSYLRLYRFFLGRNVVWQATDERECSDIRKFFGIKSKIEVLPNIPIPPASYLKTYNKEPFSLNLVYYGLIVEKKGLLNLIGILKSIDFKVTLDIYGAIKDLAYWNICKTEIENGTGNAEIRYLGNNISNNPYNILSNYDFFVLLTKGENFGHSIYESLAIGTPVIISDKTPWRFEVSSNPAGWVLNFYDNDFESGELKNLLKKLHSMDANSYSICSASAYQQAIDYFGQINFRSKYLNLFSHYSSH